MDNITNLTPHDVHLVGKDGNVVHTFFKSDNPPRLNEEKQHLGALYIGPFSNPNNVIPVVRKTYLAETDLPLQSKGKYYIVSHLLASAFPDRNDLLIPDDIVRDNGGRIVGCRGFAKV